MTKLGVAVIGTGQWGRNHARVYHELASTELVTICDVNAERAKAMAKQYGVKAYSSSAEMLKDKSIEAVNICTWSTILFQEAMKALNAGRHVLVEKPMSTTPQQARQLVKIAQQNDLHLTVGFLMRFIPGLQLIRQFVESKKIGELVSINAKRVSQWPERIGDVGVVKDTAIHDIDVMRFISRQDPTSVYAKWAANAFRNSKTTPK
jgi:UDP-N-acetylglucosamine 3-dehydrogenase